MIILGIETATQVCGVALARDGVLLCEYRSNMKNIHARVLTASIEKIWQDAQVEAGQLNGIAVSIGPGSFTGLRIGLSTAKGIAFAVGCPIMAVPTLQALAHQAPVTAGTICPILRSRPDQVYAALYRRQKGRDLLIHEATVMPATALSSFLPARTLLIGETETIPAEISLPSGCTRARKDFGLLSGYTIARLGTELLLRGELEEIECLEPRYMQEFIAGKPKKAIRQRVKKEV